MEIRLIFTLGNLTSNLKSGKFLFLYLFLFYKNAKKTISFREDMYAQDSIELLKNAGIKFMNHQSDGIEVIKFASLLITSGLVLMPGITWISFHSIYDFGYLLKILMNQRLPDTESEFFHYLKLHFKEFYDLKLLTESNNSFKGGLQELGHKYNVERVGKQHQAGSDAYLTGKIFFAIKVILL